MLLLLLILLLGYHLSGEKLVHLSYTPEKWGRPNEFTVLHYVCIKAILNKHKPDRIFLWYTQLPKENAWWELSKASLEPHKVILEGTECSGAQLERQIGLTKLYEYGGLYMDMEVILRYPIQSGLLVGSESSETRISGSFVQAPPEHVFIERWLLFYDMCSAHDEVSLNVHLPTHMASEYSINIISYPEIYYPSWEQIPLVFEPSDFEWDRTQKVYRAWEATFTYYKDITPDNIYTVFQQDTLFHRLIRPYLQRFYYYGADLTVMDKCRANPCPNLIFTNDGTCLENSNIYRMKKNPIRLIQQRISGLHRHFGYYSNIHKFCLQFNSKGLLSSENIYVPTHGIEPWMSAEQIKQIMPVRPENSVSYDGKSTELSLLLRKFKAIPWSGYSCLVPGTTLFAESPNLFESIVKFSLYAATHVRSFDRFWVLNGSRPSSSFEHDALLAALESSTPSFGSEEFAILHSKCNGSICFEHGVFSQPSQRMLISKHHANSFRELVDHFCHIKRSKNDIPVLLYSGNNVTSMNETAQTLGYKFTTPGSKFCEVAASYAAADVAIGEGPLFALMDPGSVAIGAREWKSQAFYADINFIEWEKVVEDSEELYLASAYAKRLWRHPTRDCLIPKTWNGDLVAEHNPEVCGIPRFPSQ